MPSGSEKQTKKRKLFQNIVIIIQWLLVLWLILPIYKPLHGVRHFARFAAGILLFVIISTKLLYDTVITGRSKRRNTSGEFWHLIGIVLVIILIVGMVVVFISMLVLNSLKLQT